LRRSTPYLVNHLENRTAAKTPGGGKIGRESQKGGGEKEKFQIISYNLTQKGGGMKIVLQSKLCWSICEDYLRAGALLGEREGEETERKQGARTGGGFNEKLREKEDVRSIKRCEIDLDKEKEGRRKKRMPSERDSASALEVRALLSILLGGFVGRET